MAAADEPAAFAILAAFLGIGTAFLWPAVYAISADLYPSARRGKVVGFLNVFQLLGFGAGALIGAFLVEEAHNAMFLVAVVSIGVAGLCAFAGIPAYEQPFSVRRRGLGLRDVWSSQLGALSVLVLFATAGVSMVIPAIRPYGEHQLDVSFSTLTVALIPGVILGGILYVPAGHMADRMGRTAPFIVGETLLVGGCLLVAATETLAAAAVGGAVIFAGNVFIVPAFNAAVMDLAPESHRGTLIGLMVALSGLGLALGPGIGGLIVSTLSAPAVFRIAALVAALTGAGVVLYAKRYGGAQAPPARFAHEVVD
jgi:MFS family permease